MRLIRVYHAGRNGAHRERERALVRLGIDVTLVVPTVWNDELVREDVDSPAVIELEVVRSGDVNRHMYADRNQIRDVLERIRPDVLDLHEEPFSSSAHQWLAAAPPDLPVVMYTAQNVDKRYPPPFAQYENTAHRRAQALYPCSRQAASVARGKGFTGLIEVLPLGYDDRVIYPGSQSAEDHEIVLGLFGRLVPEKGSLDAVEILARLNSARPTRLVIAGAGPLEAAVRRLAAARGVAERVELAPWQRPEELADAYRRTHVVLVPSRPTRTWVEQFGRVIVEGQASGAVVAGYTGGAIPEVVGEAGVLVDVGDTGGLARAVERLLAEPTEYEERRRVGIQHASNSTWSRVAKRQAALYRTVIEGRRPRLELPRSPRRRREVARAEFGPAASVVGGDRPFAIPILRRGGSVARTLGALLDTFGEVRARVYTSVR